MRNIQFLIFLGVCVIAYLVFNLFRRNKKQTNKISISLIIVIILAIIYQKVTDKTSESNEKTTLEKQTQTENIPEHYDIIKLEKQTQTENIPEHYDIIKLEKQTDEDTKNIKLEEEESSSDDDDIEITESSEQSNISEYKEIYHTDNINIINIRNSLLKFFKNPMVLYYQNQLKTWKFILKKTMIKTKKIKVPDIIILLILKFFGVETFNFNNQKRFISFPSFPDPFIKIKNLEAFWYWKFKLYIHEMTIFAWHLVCYNWNTFNNGSDIDKFLVNSFKNESKFFIKHFEKWIEDLDKNSIYNEFTELAEYYLSHFISAWTKIPQSEETIKDSAYREEDWVYVIRLLKSKVGFIPLICLYNQIREIDPYTTSWLYTKAATKITSKIQINSWLDKYNMILFKPINIQKLKKSVRKKKFISKFEFYTANKTQLKNPDENYKHPVRKYHLE